MLQRALPALTLCFLTLPALAQTAPTAEPQPAEAAAAPLGADGEPLPQTILVSGQRPGPGLWKVSKGDHVMWVFGTHDPLPKDMEWRSKEAERKIAQSQEYLGAPTANVSVGWSGLGALPFLIGIKKNPDGATLKDVLPPELYARWAPLKQKYFGKDDDIERERPVFVAQELHRRAMVEAGLYKGPDVRQVLGKLANKHKVKYTSNTIEVDLKEPGKAAREFKKGAMEDIPCLAATIDRLETDIEAMRVRANAWAVGELDAIEKLSFADRETACNNAFLSSALTRLQPELLTMKQRALDGWLMAAEKALENNTSTFAVLSMKEVLSPQGALAKLKAKGYTVEKPN
ncbi:MAG: TraB/GumN family protein [Pseudomonadota bacterium]